MARRTRPNDVLSVMRSVVERCYDPALETIDECGALAHYMGIELGIFKRRNG